MVNWANKSVWGVIFVVPCALAQTATVVYKRVDAAGHVTYSNAPIKGGQRVELEPLTVIPSTPGGSLRESSRGGTVVSTLPSNDVPQPVYTKLPASDIPVSRSLSSNSPPLNPHTNRVPYAEPDTAVEVPIVKPANTASLHSETLQQRLSTEKRLLAAAKSGLAAEKTNREALRAIKARTTLAQAGAPQSISASQRDVIERHFERIREWQEAIDRHEKNIRELGESAKPFSEVKAALAG